MHVVVPELANAEVKVQVSVTDSIDIAELPAIMDTRKEELTNRLLERLIV